MLSYTLSSVRIHTIRSLRAMIFRMVKESAMHRPQPVEIARLLRPPLIERSYAGLRRPDKIRPFRLSCRGTRDDRHPFTQGSIS
ncbi:hypothetical protein NITHO_1620002 [Nitrolancea hollandica Lb]|uniref:Uncharacterized protein n=1 Tax=Nitrolancea hollandica Lb TaxID=1129897 RepID=I4EDV6_9BACT|nr:hypothetical protein NITHO_1620002 [Nitrolancea hollandica Lb]